MNKRARMPISTAAVVQSCNPAAAAAEAAEAAEAKLDHQARREFTPVAKGSPERHLAVGPLRAGGSNSAVAAVPVWARFVQLSHEVEELLDLKRQACGGIVFVAILCSPLVERQCRKKVSVRKALTLLGRRQLTPSLRRWK